VSRIYAPRFATLALVESAGGAYMRDLTFYLANTPPLPVPRLDIGIGTLLQTDRSCQSALATNSVVPQGPETRWSRSTDRGWPQRRQRHFQAFRGFVLSMCCCWLTPLANTLNLRSTANSLAVLWTLASFLRCHELDSVGVSTNIIFGRMAMVGGPIREIKIPVQELRLKM